MQSREHNARGQVLLKLGQLTDALEHFNNALLGIPSFAEYLIGIALA